jgi:hypothetical protein
LCDGYVDAVQTELAFKSVVIDEMVSAEITPRIAFTGPRHLEVGDLLGIDNFISSLNNVLFIKGKIQRPTFPSHPE